MGCSATTSYKSEEAWEGNDDSGSTITLDDAKKILAAFKKKKAIEIGQPMNIIIIAVVDVVGRNLAAHERMDKDWIGSIDISIKQAFTYYRAFDILTKGLAKHSQPGGHQFFEVHASNDGKVIIFAGGIPLERYGQVIVDVAGGMAETVASEAGASAF